MRFISSSFLFLLCFITASGQSTQYHPYLTIGLGGTSYKGDLVNRYKSWGGTFHAGILLNKKKRLNGYFHLMIGGVRGQNPDYTYAKDNAATPNTYFKTTLFSLGYELRINILKTNSYTVYVSPGIAILRYNPSDQYNESYADQFATRANNETYSNVSLLLPIRIGGNYYLKSGYGIGTEIGFLHPTTDYIDNVSQLGTRSKNDNLLQLNLLLYIPLKKKSLPE